MRKIIIIILIAIAVFGGILNAKVDRQVLENVPLTETYLNCTSCLQTVLWIIFSLISGFTLLFDPEPMAMLLEKIRPKRGNIFAVRLLGFFLLAQILLSPYSLATRCQAVCIMFSK